jgi:hypothetical protein
VLLGEEGEGLLGGLEDGGVGEGGWNSGLRSAVAPGGLVVEGDDGDGVEAG